MYAFVAGTLEEIGPPTVVRAGGIGYEVWMGERQRRQLPAVGESVRVFTHLQVREDDLTLFGFTRALDREIFRALLGVNGVGPKVALSVVGDPQSEAVLRGIQRGDAKALLAVKGIGKKTAERIVLELQEKSMQWLPPQPVPLQRAEAAGGAATRLAEEAALALESMGLAPDRARAVVESELSERDHADVQALLRAALRRVKPPA